MEKKKVIAIGLTVLEFGLNYYVCNQLGKFVGNRGAKRLNEAGIGMPEVKELPEIKMPVI